MVTGLPIATIVVYVILLQPLLFCIYKHGIPGILGWAVLQIFCVVRIIGSGLTISNEETGTVTTAALIFQNIGLSPLLLGILGVLHEARTSRDPTLNKTHEWSRVFAFHSSVILGIVLIIVGVVQEISDQVTTPPAIVKVGVIILLFAWLYLCGWAAYSWRTSRQDQAVAPAWRDGTTLLVAVIVILPLLGLRVIYAILSTFITDPSFKANLAAQVCLSVVPEMLLVLILTAAALKTRNILYMRGQTGARPDASSSPFVLQPGGQNGHGGREEK